MSKPRDPRGRQEQITDERIVELLSDMPTGNGKTLLTVCKEANVSYANIRRRIYESEFLTALYTQARNDFAHLQVDRMNEIAQHEPEIQRARLLVDNIKWFSARVLPKDYGDKINIDHSGSIESTTDAQLESRLTKLLGKAGINSVVGGEGEAE